MDHFYNRVTIYSYKVNSKNKTKSSITNEKYRPAQELLRVMS